MTWTFGFGREGGPTENQDESSTKGSGRNIQQGDKQ
jgi:hypothetical protein